MTENKRTRKRKKTSSLSAYVIFSIAIVIVYTIAEFVFSGVSGITHDTLTTCFFSCFGGELLLCALIKKFKLKEDNNNGLDN